MMRNALRYRQEIECETSQWLHGTDKTEQFSKELKELLKKHNAVIIEGEFLVDNRTINFLKEI